MNKKICNSKNKVTNKKNLKLPEDFLSLMIEIPKNNKNNKSLMDILKEVRN